MRSYIIIILCVIANFAYQVLLKGVAGSISLDEFTFDAIWEILLMLISDYTFWLSLVLFGLSALFWIFGIKKVPLSKAFSILSLNYILILLYSYFVLNEEIELKKMLSCLLILFGVLILVNSKRIETLLRKRSY